MIIAHLRTAKECFDALANLYGEGPNSKEDFEETTTYIKDGKG